MAENEKPKKTMTVEAERNGIRVELVFGFDAAGVFQLLRGEQNPAGNHAKPTPPAVHDSPLPAA